MEQFNFTQAPVDAGRVRELLDSAPGGVGLTPTDYLALAEPVVRQAAAWQNDDGRIIDPFVGAETPTATARYLGALGAQLQHGRCTDLLDSARRAMNCALTDLVEVRTTWSEFIVKEALQTYRALAGRIPEPELLKMREALSSYDPEQAYAATFTHRKELYNFTTFGIAGECCKQALKLADNREFIDRYVKQQIERFDANGMYRDPNCPMTYDYTSRMNLTLALWWGCHAPDAARLDEILRDGALAMLLYLSPIGECPFGGRSNQQNFNEVTAAIICHYEARRWSRAGDATLAGAFQRAAELAVRSVAPYLQCTPVRFTKNDFPPESQHGRQKSYGFYSAYSLLIASQLGFAAEIRDDSLPVGEKCPAEQGSYFFATTPDFHKIFAAHRGTQIEIELAGDPHYDCTGWGRLHRAGAPAELALSTPLTATPEYLTSVPPERPLALASPAVCAAVAPSTKTIPVRADASGVEFIVEWQTAAEKFVEHYRLTDDGVELEFTSEHPGAEYLVPLLLTNGHRKSQLEVLDTGFAVNYATWRYSVTATGAAELRLNRRPLPNRNGLYLTGTIRAAGTRLQLSFRLSPN